MVAARLEAMTKNDISQSDSSIAENFFLKFYSRGQTSNEQINRFTELCEKSREN